MPSMCPVLVSPQNHRQVRTQVVFWQETKLPLFVTLFLVLIFGSLSCAQGLHLAGSSHMGNQGSNPSLLRASQTPSLLCSHSRPYIVALLSICSGAEESSEEPWVQALMATFSPALGMAQVSLIHPGHAALFPRPDQTPCPAQPVIS